MSHTHYSGFRIDNRLRTLGCWKIRHRGLDGYIAIDFPTLKAAKAFLKKKRETK